MSGTPPKTIAVDLDGTLAFYDGWKGWDKIGPVLPGARDFLMELKRRGCEIVIYTTRCNPNTPGKDGITKEELALKVEGWMYHNDMPYDSIYQGEGKPLCAAIVDDRAVECEPMKHQEEAYSDALAKIDDLLGGHW